MTVGAGDGSGTRRSGRWHGLRLAAGIGTLALGVHVVIPQLAGLQATGDQLAHATWWLPLLVLCLETASLLTYGELILSNLRRLGDPAPRSLVQRGVVVGTSLGRTLPAGNAAAFAVVVAAFRSSRIDALRASTALATSGLLSSLVLAALLPIGAVLTAATGRLGGIAIPAVVAAAVILLAGGLAPFVAQKPAALAERVGRVVAALARGPLRRRLDPAHVSETIGRGVDGVRRLASDRRGLFVSGGWATANWLLDVAVVVVLAMTIGRGTPLAGILLAYVIAQLAASIPLTPGGVGFVETSMIGALVAAGAPAAAATTTVLGWRLVSHWLPIGVGLLLLPSMLGSRSGASNIRPRRRRRPDR